MWQALFKIVRKITLRELCLQVLYPNNFWELEIDKKLSCKKISYHLQKVVKEKRTNRMNKKFDSYRFFFFFFPNSSEMTSQPFFLLKIKDFQYISDRFDKMMVTYHFPSPLTLSQTTNFRLFQTETVCRQFKI